MRNDGPDFDRTPACRRDSRGQSQSLVEVFGFDEVIASKLFLGFGERAIQDRPLALAHPNGLGLGNPIQFVAASHVAATGNAFGEFHVLLIDFLLFRRAHLVKLVFVSVNKQQILHFVRPPRLYWWLIEPAASLSTNWEQIFSSELGRRRTSPPLHPAFMAK